MRKEIQINVDDANVFLRKLILFSSNFDTFLFLNSNSTAFKDKLPFNYINYDYIVAIDKISYSVSTENSLNSLRKYTNINDWIFLHLSYDLKNEIYNLNSKNPDFIGFPIYYVFQPLWIIICRKGTLSILYPNKTSKSEALNFIKKINNVQIEEYKSFIVGEDILSLNKYSYLRTASQIKQNIQRGDIYEMNYCVEFKKDNISINPYKTYMELIKYSPSPFSAFYRLNDKYLISASPERFLCKNNNILISQPIKGTTPRGKNENDDYDLKNYLKNSVKEISENIMITDLVRNDLSVCAEYGSVRVDELCGVYTFPHVHQMISTISCQLRPSINFVDIIKNTFPMGSMTGAPKKRAIQLIDQYEDFKRGLFSGSVGYITPEKNFDLNVIIRSILYNDSLRHLSIPAGSAITSKSNIDKEYNEILLKARALSKVLISKE